MKKSFWMANECLRILKEWKETYTSIYCSPQQIAAKFKTQAGDPIPLPAQQHTMLRSVLERLYNADKIERDGTNGHYKWRIEVDSWDKLDPFGKTKTYKVPPGLIGINVAEAETLKKYRETNIELRKEIESLEKSKKELEEALQSLKDEKDTKDSYVKVLHVKRFDKQEYKIKDVVLPKVFKRVKELAECRRNILLVGPAGCGKTHLAKLVADVLKLDFASLSCTAGMSESHLLGRSVPDLTHGKNKFQGTDFLSVYEKGGIALLDELDAADPNLMLVINSGLANNYMNVPNRPDKPRAVRHEDFICIATANTFGRGATRQYAGRNQLDEATLDRFRIGIVEMDYDDGVEKALCPDDGKAFILYHAGIKSEDNTIKNLLALGFGLRGTCQYIRSKIEAASLRRLMSSRFMQDAWIMHDDSRWDLKQILEVFFEGWTPEEKAKVA